jgi:hypothetical protein
MIADSGKCLDFVIDDVMGIQATPAVQIAAAQIDCSSWRQQVKLAGVAKGLLLYMA